MVKFTAAGPGGRTIIGFGITAANVEKLKAGNPIVVHLEELNLPHKIDVTIFYGETEQSIADGFQREGAIGPQTIINKKRKPS